MSVSATLHTRVVGLKLRTTPPELLAVQLAPELVTPNGAATDAVLLVVEIVPDDMVAVTMTS